LDITNVDIGVAGGRGGPTGRAAPEFAASDSAAALPVNGCPIAPGLTFAKPLHVPPGCHPHPIPGQYDHAPE